MLKYVIAIVGLFIISSLLYACDYTPVPQKVSYLPDSKMKCGCDCNKGKKCTCTAKDGCCCGDKCKCDKCPGKKAVPTEPVKPKTAAPDCPNGKCIIPSTVTPQLVPSVCPNGVCPAPSSQPRFRLFPRRG